MRYECGHRGCDLCGKEECGETLTITSRGIMACKWCTDSSIALAFNAACRFGGVVIDSSRSPCKEHRRVEEALQSLIADGDVTF